MRPSFRAGQRRIQFAYNLRNLGTTVPLPLLTAPPNTLWPPKKHMLVCLCVVRDA